MALNELTGWALLIGIVLIDLGVAFLVFGWISILTNPIPKPKSKIIIIDAIKDGTSKFYVNEEGEARSMK